MAKIDDVFVKLCREKFKFLEDEFGFRRTRPAINHGPGYVLYTNHTTGVEISYDRRDGVVAVILMRLADGKPPRFDDLRKGLPLWALARLRAHAVTVSMDRRQERTEAEIEAAVSEDAATVRAYAADILRGDFSVFPELERIVAEEWQGGQAASAGMGPPAP